MLTSTLATPAHNHNDETTKHRSRKPGCFFELNDTDGDLGIHGKIDGDEWRRLKIEDPHERKMLDVKVKGRRNRRARLAGRPSRNTGSGWTTRRSGCFCPKLRGKRLGEIGGDDAIAYLLQARNDPQANIRANVDAIILQETAVTAAN
jgi:hypothetical protein